jgi:Ca2+-binding EF-hand superfamily protein
MMRKILIASAGIAALAAAAAGIAQTAQTRPPVAADGSVRVSDMRQRADARFEALDANKDNKISRQELQDRRGDMRNGRGPRVRGPRGGPAGGRGGAMFGGADANRDGIVTQSEITANAAQRFQRIDANHDGRIVREEMQALRGGFGGERGGPGRFGARGGRGGQGRLAMLDADRDGTISRGEFQRAQADRIARLDANRDGKVTREERRASRPGRSGPGGARQF